MHRIALCEDDRRDREILARHIRRAFADFKKPARVVEFLNGRDFLDRASPYAFDIALFDVEMEPVDGITAAKAFRQRDKSAIIAFITHHPEFVFASFSAEPLNYLLKPVKYSQVKALLARALEMTEQMRARAFSFKSNGTLYNVPVSKIAYIESKARVLQVHAVDGEYAYYGKLGDAQGDPSLAGFIRCHKSFLVNPWFIEHLGGGFIGLSTGSAIPISRSKSAEVRKSFADYLAQASHGL